MDVKNNILEAIGKTPLIRINKVTSHLPAQVFAKVESFNPGDLSKSRVRIKMIEDAEKAGKIKPGATIIESTSGDLVWACTCLCHRRLQMHFHGL